MTTLYRRFGKRALDLSLAGVALGFTAPLLAGLGVAVARALGRPVLFSQPRIGRAGRRFTLFKLRTMTEARDAGGQLLGDAQRSTPLGRRLRRHGLDELPSLWLVLRGHMSLVGPRPLLVEYLPWYSPHEATRHQVRPGLTGWAQVHGRNAVGWDQRLALDAWYVQNMSLALDLRILARTVALVMSGRGEHAPGHVTMPRLDHVRGADR